MLSSTSTTFVALLSLISATTAAPTNAPTPPTSAPSSTPSSSLTLFQQLTLASTAVERLSLLSDSDLVFSFNKDPGEAGVVSGDGGKTVRADHATFPALVGQGGSMTLGFLGPCGFNTPHVHPRAAELNIVVQGHLFASVTAENGARHINHTLSQYDMTVFPAGAIHTEFNPDCTPSVFVAAFPNEDPGVGQIAQEYFGLEDEIIAGSVGGELSINGEDIDAFRTKIPMNVAKGVDSCLARCNIAKK
jgi:hypothetical protein